MKFKNQLNIALMGDRLLGWNGGVDFFLRIFLKTFFYKV